MLITAFTSFVFLLGLCVGDHNVTISNEHGDEETGVFPQYEPANTWSQDTFKPDPGDGNPDNLSSSSVVTVMSTPPGNYEDVQFSMSLSFKGTAIYVVFVLQDGSTSLTFTLDDQYAGTFNYQEPLALVVFNATVYSNTNLPLNGNGPNGFHNLTITTQNTVSFDFAEYTVPDSDVSPTHTTTSAPDNQASPASTKTSETPLGSLAIPKLTQSASHATLSISTTASATSSGSLGIPNWTSSGSLGIPEETSSGSLGVPEETSSGSLGILNSTQSASHAALSASTTASVTSSGSLGIPNLTQPASPAATSTSTTTPAGSLGVPNSTKPASHSTLSAGAIAGISVGAAAGILSIAWCIYRRTSNSQRRQRPKTQDVNPFEVESSLPSPLAVPTEFSATTNHRQGSLHASMERPPSPTYGSPTSQSNSVTSLLIGDRKPEAEHISSRSSEGDMRQLLSPISASTGANSSETRPSPRLEEDVMALRNQMERLESQVRLASATAIQAQTSLLESQLYMGRDTPPPSY